MLKISPYKLGSASAKALAQRLNVKRIKPRGRYSPGPSVNVLNWGTTKPHFQSRRWLNVPESVAVAVDKLKALQVMVAAGVSCVPFTTDINEAKEWLEEGRKVVCRHMLRSSGGAGITVVGENGHLPYAPLYTKYIRKDDEYRVHVFQGRIIDAVTKRRSYSKPCNNEYIRSYENGWVFCRNASQAPDIVVQASLQAVEALGLDFGAVDIIMRKDRAYVLEVNTAPGLQGTTIDRYVEAIRKYL